MYEAWKVERSERPLKSGLRTPCNERSDNPPAPSSIVDSQDSGIPMAPLQESVGANPPNEIPIPRHEIDQASPKTGTSLRELSEMAEAKGTHLLSITDEFQRDGASKRKRCQ
jgi:hypothetical protein